MMKILLHYKYQILKIQLRRFILFYFFGELNTSAFFLSLSLHLTICMCDNVFNHLIKCFSTLYEDKEKKNKSANESSFQYICLLTNHHYTSEQLSNRTIYFFICTNRVCAISQITYCCLVTNDKRSLN
jgi:hypothetical protein